MILKFTKMQGAGNDYIYFNALQSAVPNPSKLAIKISDRNFGVGGDGIIVIEPSKTADAFMRMFNADGSEGKMCGNAIRCVAKYLCDHHIVSGNTVKIDTLSGIKSIEVIKNKGKVTHATVNMGSPILNPKKIPVLLDGDSVIDREVQIGNSGYKVTCVSMGNPHCVVFCEGIDGLNLPQIGKQFEFSPLFPERVNTEFIEIKGRNKLKMRVWERGSGETLACGTGACAAAVAAVLNGFCDKDENIEVELRGGNLLIRYSGDTVYMTGEAVTVFEGEMELEDL